MTYPQYPGFEPHTVIEWNSFDNPQDILEFKSVIAEPFIQEYKQATGGWIRCEHYLVQGCTHPRSEFSGNRKRSSYCLSMCTYQLIGLFPTASRAVCFTAALDYPPHRFSGGTPGIRLDEKR